jgi:hypothetical protein
MGEVGMEVPYPRPGKEGVDEVSGLEQVAKGGGRSAPAEAPDHEAKSPPVSIRVGSREQGVVVEKPRQMNNERLRQVSRSGFDLRDTAVGKALPGLAHGEEGKGETEPFEEKDLVGDEGFRDAGVALQDVTEDRPRPMAPVAI